ncbi:Ferrochelatase [Sulfurovum sp. enrichment culture clone C5]|uniref:Ferrochelatase n=1 Tax=Sulfurovum sp. enrichment culture clone C5 TaxID=497650 RepID=A0A0S4XNU5_9BACT|nr:Ferrochelatase [Sulfurovum sp. enrichment culture clone C5]
MKKAILLLNMGGPNNLDEVKMFLHNMFNDPQIISAPKPLRWLISKIIIAKRLNSAKANYKLLGGKSPLVGHTQKLINKLKTKVDADVYMVMRYTPPFAKDIISEIKNHDEIYAIPLYPQYSNTTTLSSFDDLFDMANKLGIGDKIKTIDCYQTHPLYISSIIEKIKEALGSDDASEFELIFSAHGLPQKIIDRGDLYQEHIIQSVESTKQALKGSGIHFGNTHLAYQSRLGPIEWLRPYMDDKLHEFKGKKVIVFPVAFTIDNSETECELDIEYRHLANEIGIIDYRVAKAPNDHDDFVECLVDIYKGMGKDD